MWAANGKQWSGLMGNAIFTQLEVAPQNNNALCKRLVRVRNPKNQLSQIDPPTIVGCSL